MYNTNVQRPPEPLLQQPIKFHLFILLLLLLLLLKVLQL
jgi:hypothetical protein